MQWQAECMADDVSCPRIMYTHRSDPDRHLSAAGGNQLSFLLVLDKTGWVCTDAVVMATVVSALFAAAPSPQSGRSS